MSPTRIGRTRIDLDFTELAGQAEAMEQQLGSLLAQIKKAIEQQQQGEAPEAPWAVESETETEDSGKKNRD